MNKQSVILVRAERLNGLCNKVGFPANEAAKYACSLVKRDYLTQEEMVIFQKLGFTIEVN